jgi:MFS family permease
MPPILSTRSPRACDIDIGALHVSDASQPRDRARVVGIYRVWRDFGFVLGALIAGIGADATSPRTAILIVAALTGASGLLVAAASWKPRAVLQPNPRLVIGE